MSDLKAKTPAQVEAQIDDIKEKLADPATPSIHKSFLAALLKLLLSWLPVVIDMFHHASGTASGSVVIPGVGAPAIPDENKEPVA